MTAEAKKEPRAFASWLSSLPEKLIPVLAVVTALAIGAIVIWATKASVVKAYRGLIEGALFGVTNFTETLVIATPYTLAGLAVALASRCGLFNIGAEGQFYMGALFAVYIGFAVKGLPAVVHLPLAVLAGALGGAVWGAIPGILKAKLGAHEVTNAIMLNYIAVKVVDYVVKNPFRDRTSTIPRTPYILPTATLPRLLTDHRVHAGLLIAIAAVFVVYWLLWKTTLGFELRMTGSNPNAARYAGVNITRNTVIAMALSGALAGIAGTFEILGVSTCRCMQLFFSSGYGFDSIAIALLAKNNPFGIIVSALLFGAMRNGADFMELNSGVSKYIISLIQALLLLFVAAPSIIRGIYRMRAPKQEEEMVEARGWGR